MELNLMNLKLYMKYFISLLNCCRQFSEIHKLVKKNAQLLSLSPNLSLTAI